jgi:ClpP class serine protease
MSNRLPFIAQRMFNRPLAITPEKAEIVVAALAERLGVIQLNRLDGSARKFADESITIIEEHDEPEPVRRGYDLVDGVAVIQVEGTLVHKNGCLRPYSGMTGYDGIRINLLTALSDPKAKGIAFDIDSPGGECAGCFDLADMIFAARGKKPMWAIPTETACSAAFALASSCDRVIVPRTGVTGSIGIIAMHVNMSGWLDKNGFVVTLLKYGQKKDDFAETKPLSKDAFNRAMADINTMGGMFDALVARNRKMDAAKVKSYQAGTFMGADGVAAKLADAVMAPDAAMNELIAVANKRAA